MKLPPAFLAVAVAPPATGRVFRQAQEVDVVAGEGATPVSAFRPLTMTVPEYDESQCERWIRGALATDTDGSGGISEAEFQDFLQGVAPASEADMFLDRDASAYPALPWLFKAAHKTMACQCKALGMGAGCCLGAGAEIPLAGLEGDQLEGPWEEYRADLCNYIAATFERVMPGSITAPTDPAEPTEPATAPPVEAPVTAAPVAAPAETDDEETDDEETDDEGTADACVLCPADGPAVAPDLPIPPPAADGTTCGVVAVYAGTLAADSTDCATALMAQDFCCTATDDPDGGGDPTEPTEPGTEPPVEAPVTTAPVAAPADPCDFCPGGVTVAADAEVPGAGGFNCAQIGAFSDGLVGSDGQCAQLLLAETFCCPTGPVEPTTTAAPVAAPGAPCAFCPGGLTVDDAFGIPGGDGLTCGQVVVFATNLDGGDGLCAQALLAQEICCPSTDDLTDPDGDGDGAETCAFCPGGLTADDAAEIPGGNGFTCGQVVVFAAGLDASDGLCAQSLLAQEFCCPAPTEPTEPPPTEPTDPSEPAATTAPAAAPTEPTEPTPAPAESDSPLELNVVASSLDYSSFDYTDIFSADVDAEGEPEGVPDFYNAEEIMDGDGNVLVEVVEAFDNLTKSLVDMEFVAGSDNAGTTSAAGRQRRGLRGRTRRTLQTAEAEIKLKPVIVTDISCPAGLPYAPQGAFCLNFNFEFDAPDPAVAATMETLVDSLDTAIKEGGLYDALLEINPETPIAGMGSPGKGIPFEDNVSGLERSGEGGEDDGDDGGLSGGMLALVIVCVVGIPIILLAFYASSKKKKDEEFQQKLAKHNARQDLAAQQQAGASAAREVVPAAAVPLGDEESAAPSVMSEEDKGFDDVEGRPKSMAGSSLAAIGVAGAAAATARKGDKASTASIRAEVEQLVKETNAPKSADDLLKTYAGREDELLKHLRKMKLKLVQQAEIKSLVASTNPGKSYEELAATYAGREDELIKNLKKMQSKQNLASREMTEEEAKRAEVKALVASTSPGKSADELLDAYKGREDELIKNLKTMQSKQMRASQRNMAIAELEAKKATVRSLVESTNPGKSAEELLSSYEGREDELIKNLTKMQSKQMSQSSLQAESTEAKKRQVAALVAITKPGKSAEELLKAYEGREDALVKNLTMMQQKQLKDKQRAEVTTLVAGMAIGKSVEELLDAYEGNEDELLVNLKKMKSKQDVAAGAAKAVDPNKAAKQASIRELVTEVNPGKTADELLTAYDGKEDDLIRNLEKMKSKKAKKADREVKREKQESIKALVTEVNPGKSAEELMAAYEGKEDDLIKNLEKMKAKTARAEERKVKKEKQESIKQLVTETNTGKSAEELMAAYEGREDELIKNLEKMKSKQGKNEEKKAKMEKRESIKQLVTETNPGKSAEELMTAYDGKEDDLIRNLEKMKSKQGEKKKAQMEKRESIKQLVTETNPGKSAEELIAAYDGREDELIKNLEKMKSKQGEKKKAQMKKGESIKQLVAETNPGKSAEELIAIYDGREDELIKNLEKMKSKQEKTRAGQSSLADAGTKDPSAAGTTASLQDQVRSLVSETSPGKSADDLLAAYKGREAELVVHLTKLKKSDIKLS